MYENGLHIKSPTILNTQTKPNQTKQFYTYKQFYFKQLLLELFDCLKEKQFYFKQFSLAYVEFFLFKHI